MVIHADIEFEIKEDTIEITAEPRKLMSLDLSLRSKGAFYYDAEEPNVYMRKLIN